MSHTPLTDAVENAARESGDMSMAFDRMCAHARQQEEIIRLPYSERHGGPAYPTVSRDGNWNPHHDGMRLRDYFAAQALAGMLAKPTEPDSAYAWAGAAYVIADAMLAARDK
jgi:alpha-ketoglutarate-dependent taurine dioxygenase